MKCRVSGCRWPIQESDLCSAHLRRDRAYGDPLADSLSDWDRFLSHVVATANGCLTWTGAISPEGYGRSSWGLPHRYAYEHQVGPIPDGMELDHLCHTRDTACLGGPSCPHRRCVYWVHLEPVPQKENARRSRAGEVNGARLRAQTHCKRNHPLWGENVRWTPSGARVCRSCARLSKGRPVDLALLSRIEAPEISLAGHEEGP